MHRYFSSLKKIDKTPKNIRNKNFGTLQESTKLNMSKYGLKKSESSTHFFNITQNISH